MAGLFFCSLALLCTSTLALPWDLQGLSHFPYNKHDIRAPYPTYTLTASTDGIFPTGPTCPTATGTGTGPGTTYPTPTGYYLKPKRCISCSTGTGSPVFATGTGTGTGYAYPTPTPNYAREATPQFGKVRRAEFHPYWPMGPRHQARNPAPTAPGTGTAASTGFMMMPTGTAPVRPTGY